MKPSMRKSLITTVVIFAAMSFVPSSLFGAAPSAAQALKLTPTQDGVDYDHPKPEDVANCKISAKKIDGHVGWIVESPDGAVLRRFVDTNDDNVVDQWSYYKDGVEVYRDIDSKFTGKADQFRWFNTAGTRWGVDANGDGKLEAWKVISAEEVSAEIVAALASRDVERFTRVLLTADELQSLGLGKTKNDAVAAKIAKAETDFKVLAARTSPVAQSKWLQFSGSKPGTVPAGTDGSTKDLHAYENVLAIVQIGEKHTQVHVGTIVQVGSTWKAIDAPLLGAEGQAETTASGLFFQATPAARSVASAGAPSEEMQKLLAELDKIEPGDLRRADVLQQIADLAKTPEDHTLWYKQLADTISAAVQTGKCADGDKRLQALFEKLQKNESDKNLAAYVKFRQLIASYALSLQAPKADVAKIQTEWPKSLEQYVADHPTSPDAAEAMLQLGIAREYAAQEEDAKKWYSRIVSTYPDSPQAKKAAGAATRLDSVGKTIALSGKSPTGAAVDLASLRGKVVLIQYWATWSNAAKNDMATLKQLAAKYGKSFTVLGVSLDTSAKDLNAYLTENELPWQQIFEEGGPDSRPANLLGIITVPTMILVDAQGKVVSRNIQASEIEAELKKLMP